MSTLPPIELIGFAAQRLGELVHEVVFLGGAVVGLLVTDPAAPPPRATKDVDAAIEINSIIAYYELDAKLLKLGFTNDMRGPVCRYLHGPVMLDIMPTNPEILGFSNRWYSHAIETAMPFVLANGVTIKLISAPCFLATKLEAFTDPQRESHHDVFVSRDFADVIRVMDGRPTLGDEILASDPELAQYLKTEFEAMLLNTYLEEAIAENVDPGRETKVLEFIQAFAK